AEGSDWCWWYGDDHSSDNDAAFDALFRKHLKNVYTLIGRKPPKYLDLPIKKVRLVRPVKEPAYLIQPILDGEITNYFEWLAAGHFDISRAKGTMHQIETILQEIYYGFSMTDLFLRLQVNLDLSSSEAKSFSFAVIFSSPTDKKAEISYDFEQGRYLFKFFAMGGKQDWEYLRDLESFGVGSIIELGVPFSGLGAKATQKVEFVIIVSKDG
ncbi:MAG: hypothetical protein ACPL4K_04700, partial [Candidatus Margulisiibacteriota bacterium]